MAFNKSGGCHDFFKYFGGEVTRGIVGSNLKLIKDILGILGKPYLIEFEIGFYELPELRKTSIAHQLLEWKMMKEKWNPSEILSSEAYVRFNIPGERIRNIIPFQLIRTEK